VSELTPKQLEAVAGIAKGLATRQIAKVVGVSSRTVERWRKLPEFVAAITRIQGNASRQVEAELVSDITCVTSRLENLASKSLDCLEQIIDNPETRNSDRIQASKIILSEWQRSQTPATDELRAVKVLVESGFLSYEQLQRLKAAVDTLTQESRAIFQQTSVTSVVRSETLN
jgi:DNA-directed RNA polymerase specialized sigma24 family protein